MLPIYYSTTCCQLLISFESLTDKSGHDLSHDVLTYNFFALPDQPLGL
jgi:hypothetical protein